MTPTEAINTLYYDDMDILHIDNWRFFTPKKRDRDDTPQRFKQFHTYYAPLLENGPYPSLNQLDKCPNRGRLLPGAKLSAQAVKFVPTI